MAGKRSENGEIYELNENEIEQRSVKRYEPVAKAVVGRIWSKIMREEWVDGKGKKHPSAYFKLFLWAGEPKYRCHLAFEQADEAASMLQKGDWVVCFGLDDLTETYKTHKRFHNFRVIKLWIMPETKGIWDVRYIARMMRSMLSGVQEHEDRIAWLEKQVERLTGEKPLKPEEAPPRGDEPKIKKRQSLYPVVGDIYTDTEED